MSSQKRRRSALQILVMHLKSLCSSTPQNSQRHEPRRLKFDGLERREYLSADGLGVVRGSDQWLLDVDRDPFQEVDLSYGLSGDAAVVGNWDGTTEHPGVVRQGGDGLLHWFLDTDGDPTHELEIAYGLPGDVPVVGDWDGDGQDNVGVVRQGGDGLLHWFLDTDGDPTHELDIAYGLPGDVPVVGDWDGDGRDNVGVVRPWGDGLLHWFLDTDGDPTHELDIAYGLPGDVPVVGNWKFPELSVEGYASQFDFGVVQPGGPSPTRSLTLRNDGNVPLLLNSAELSPGFVLLESIPAQLAPGESFVAQIGLDMQRSGTREGRLRLTSNDGNEGELTIGLVGRVAEPDISVFDRPGEHEVRGDVPDGTGNVPLGWTLVGGPGPARTLEITNRGDAPLNLGRVGFEGNFGFAESFPARTLGPGESATLWVRLADSAQPGEYQGRVSIASNDPDESPFDFGVSARVEVPRVEVHVDHAGSEVFDDRGRIDFGKTPQGEPGATQTFRVTNHGNIPAQLGAVQVQPGFEVIDGLVSTLGPGESDKVTLRMRTDFVGHFSSGLTFSTSDPARPLFDFRLTGDVVARDPELRLGGVPEFGSVDFGYVTAGKESARRTFTIYNDGNVDLLIGAVYVPEGFHVVSAPQSIAPGHKASLVIALESNVPGQKGGHVTIVSNDVDHNPRQFSVVGQTRAAPVAPTPVLPIPFGASTTVSQHAAMVDRLLGSAAQQLGQGELSDTISQLAASHAAAKKKLHQFTLDLENRTNVAVQIDVLLKRSGKWRESQELIIGPGESAHLEIESRFSAYRIHGEIVGLGHKSGPKYRTLGANLEFRGIQFVPGSDGRKIEFVTA